MLANSKNGTRLPALIRKRLLGLLIFAVPMMPAEAALEGTRIVFDPLIVAGDALGAPADSAANRIDANTFTSAFAGVGSLRIETPSGAYLCSGTAISSTVVVTAGHCFDINGDGISEATSAEFKLNIGGNETHSVSAKSINLHSDFTGFANPSINDDIAVVVLDEALPAEVPIYALNRTPIDAGTLFTMVGYGRSGDGVNGYTTGASFSIKRVGQNIVDVFLVDDEFGGVNEVFAFDFDHPTNVALNLFGGDSLGNDIETTLGPGDSGGPSFIDIDGELFLAGINTFTFSFVFSPGAPEFGSGGGGILVSAYTDFLDQFGSVAVPLPAPIVVFASGLAVLMCHRMPRRDPSHSRAANER